MVIDIEEYQRQQRQMEQEEQGNPQEIAPRTQPSSDIDFNLMVTDSVWGRTDISPGLKSKLTKSYLVESTDNKGNKTTKVSKESMWDWLGYYTRDMRLGNLSTFNNELQVCRYYLDLAGDFLTIDMIEPFLICLSRAATIIETSQSKGGFLRRLMNTLRHENITTNMEPPKKGFFGGKRQEQ